MTIDRVTITGADHSIKPADLARLSRAYPFVEWGILVSNARMGEQRFPSMRWIWSLQDIARSEFMRLSLHVCGRWTRQLLLGVNEIPASLLDDFRRVQLNFRDDLVIEVNAKPLRDAIAKINDDVPRHYIFQVRSALGNSYLNALHAEGDANISAVALFDASGGAGRIPDKWPSPIYMDSFADQYAYHGYAGGLGPDNLVEQLPLILKAAGTARIWIDMETRVRSDNDSRFDLAKVERCLEIAAPYVRGQA